ncbi:MAG: DUF2974 domain-containing protein [Rhodocyclaceae bacterium]|nr:DUF2974 domain-containing protein [Rhodocyclaceae bacterium]
MGLADAIKSQLAPWLAEKQSRELQEGAARKTDAMRQQDYDVARQSMLGEFSSQPISSCQECMANAKAARRKERLDLTKRALATCPDHEGEARRLRQDMDEVENMRCAKQVYLANDPNAPAELRDNPPPGFRKATEEDLAKMGLNDKMLSPERSNFRAAVYMKDPAVWGENAKPAAVVAFRGSTSEKEDWDNNFAQDANREAPYYKNAVQIGNALAFNNANVHIVGHSLGGGLASAAQGGSGLTASTYNAAGLNPATVARYSQDSEHMAAEANKITAIRVQGEVLTKTQESGLTGMLASEAVGMKRDLIPSHDRSYLDGLKKMGKADQADDYATYLHGMDEVIASTEKQKSADEAALKDCIGKGAQ